MLFQLIINLITFNLIASQTIELNVQTNSMFNGPINMGVNLGHANINSNWAMFLDRLGVNAARLFVTGSTDLRNFLGKTQFGNDLNGNSLYFTK